MNFYVGKLPDLKKLVFIINLLLSKGKSLRGTINIFGTIIQGSKVQKYQGSMLISKYSYINKVWVQVFEKI